MTFPRREAGGRKRLIVSGDDFGLSPGTNFGIIKAHRDGILTNASLMVNGSAFAEAVELARATPGLSVGLHLVLVQGRATSAPSDIPDLVDGAGMFPNSAPAAGFRYFFVPRLRPPRNKVFARCPPGARAGSSRPIPTA